MAILCGPSAPIVTDEPDSWSSRHTPFGISAHRKNKFNPRVWSAWTRPSIWTGFYARRTWNQMYSAFIYHQWEADPNVDKGLYNSVAPLNQFHNVDGLLKTPNGFQLFSWQCLSHSKAITMWDVSMGGITIFANANPRITSSWLEHPPPLINSVTWSVSGALTLNVTPSIATNDAVYLVGLVPPQFPPSDARHAIDAWYYVGPSLTHTTITCPFTAWDAELLSVKAGQTWGIFIRQSSEPGGTGTPSQLANSTVTIGA